MRTQTHNETDSQDRVKDHGEESNPCGPDRHFCPITRKTKVWGSPHKEGGQIGGGGGGRLEASSSEGPTHDDAAGMALAARCMGYQKDRSTERGGKRSTPKR